MKGESNLKKFETPVIEIAKFEIVDVITTSNGLGGDGEYGGGEWE